MLLQLATNKSPYSVNCPCEPFTLSLELHLVPRETFAFLRLQLLLLVVCVLYCTLLLLLLVP